MDSTHSASIHPPETPTTTSDPPTTRGRTVSRTDRHTFPDDDVTVSHAKSYATGVPAALVSLRRGVEQMGWFVPLTKLN